MSPLFLWILLTVGAAAVVLVVTGATTGDRGQLRTFVDDLRAGVAQRVGRSRTEPSPEVVRAVEVEPVDTSLEDFFAATQVAEEPYVKADALARTLQQAKERVVGGVQSLTNR